VKSFANPDVPRPRRPVPDITHRRPPPRQSPITVLLPPPDPAVIDDAARWAITAAAHRDRNLSHAERNALVVLLDATDRYGVLHGSASALAERMGVDESGGRRLARVLSTRSYLVRRPDGKLQIQNPSVKGVTGRSVPAGAQHPESGQSAPGKRAVSTRTPPPIGGGGERAPASKRRRSPSPATTARPERAPAPDLEAWDGPTDAGRAAIAQIKNREKLL
jgi:hypothetical protein